MRSVPARPPAGAPVLPGLVLLLLLLNPCPAPAQDPAMVTIDAFPLGAGSVELSYGVDYMEKESPDGRTSNFPSSQGPYLRTLVRVLPASARIGVSSNVDIVGGWRGRLLTKAGDGAAYRDWGDPWVYTKVTLTDTGTAFAAALLCGFKVPSTRYLPAGLGSDAADVYFLSAFAWRFARGAIRANAGAAITGDPRHTGSQDDMLTGGLLALWNPVDAGGVFAELSGFTGPKEEDDKLQLRWGASVELPIGTLTVYALGKVAGSPYDFSTAFAGSPAWGIGASLTHRFGL